MERDKRVFRDFENRQRDFKLKKLIIKKNAKIYPKKDYLIIVDEDELIIGYRYISEIYINADNSVPLKYLIKLASKKKVFIIDNFGYIIGEIKWNL